MVPHLLEYQLSDLIDAYLDATLTPEQGEVLQVLVRAHPKAWVTQRCRSPRWPASAVDPVRFPGSKWSGGFDEGGGTHVCRDRREGLHFPLELF
ncbi:MAG: hypothetical protein P8L18_16315 [Verrucomicrobiota bacterium]|jgi:hypothetical protein|nr:hypothetical protein [Verrucomicrobiota bacterium]